MNAADQLFQIAREYVDAAFDIADRYLESTECQEFVISLHEVDIAVVVPSSFEESAILADAFCSADPNALVSWRLVVIDSSAGYEPPRRRWSPALNQPTGQLRLSDESIRIAIDPIVQVVWVMDRLRKCVLAFVPSLLEIPRWWLATPLRLGMSWIADVLDSEFVHGAAVGRDGKGIVLAGPSGVGKSTLSLKLSLAGWEFLSDDFFLMKETTARAIYRRAKLNSDSLSALRCQPLPTFVESETPTKSIIDVWTHDEVAHTAQLNIQAIAFPSLAPFSGLQPVDRARAFMELGPATLAGLQGGSLRSFSRLAQIINSCSLYRFGVIGALDEISGALEAVRVA